MGAVIEFPAKVEPVDDGYAPGAVVICGDRCMWQRSAQPGWWQRFGSADLTPVEELRKPLALVISDPDQTVSLWAARRALAAIGAQNRTLYHGLQEIADAKASTSATTLRGMAASVVREATRDFAGPDEVEPDFAPVEPGDAPQPSDDPERWPSLASLGLTRRSAE